MTEQDCDVFATTARVRASTRSGDDAVGVDYVAAALAGGIGRAREHLGGEDLVALVGQSLGTLIVVHTHARWSVADFLISTSTRYCSTALPAPYRPRGANRRCGRLHCWLPTEDRARVFYHSPATDPDEYDNTTLRTFIARRIWQDSITFRAHP